MSKDSTQRPRPVSNRGPFDPKSDAVTDWPLRLSTFLHHGIEEVERHFLRKLHKRIRRKSWSKALPKLLAGSRFLYKVVCKIDPLRKFNRAREIEFTFFIAWTIFMKFGTPVQYVHGYKRGAEIFYFCLGT